MKCLKKNGKVIRVSDQKAEELKHEGYEFCPKSEWKNDKKTNKAGQARKERAS